MIRLKHISVVAVFGALSIGACGDDGGDTYAGTGGAGASAGGAGGTSKGGSGGTSKGGSGGSSKGGSGNAGEGTDGGAPTNEAGAGGAGPEVVPCPELVGDVTASYARAICLKQQECCVDAGQTLEDCITATQANLDLIYEELVASVTADRSSLSCTNFDTCVAAINATDCSAWPVSNGAQGGVFISEPACRQVIEPQLTATTACSHSYECIGGFCSTTCQAFNARDASCTSGVCDLISDYCYDHGTAAQDDDTCEARLANEAPCTSHVQCRSGNCDPDADMCAVPTECVWVPPDIATTCSTSAAGRSSPLGTMGIGLLLGLAAMGIRRRQRRRD